jgi:tRNA threonylcarbamoyl adenosine modification protein YeaZ
LLVLVLALDTSSAATAVALARVEPGAIAIVARRVNIDARAHGEVLTPAIRSCLEDAGATVGELAAIVAGIGPGPYTGLRVGLVTAAALGDALACPTYGVCSLDAIAGAVFAGHESGDGHLFGGRLLVAADARRREVYWAAYDEGIRIDGPAVTKPADLDTDGISAMVGAGARLYADSIGAGRMTILDQDFPDPGALIAVAADRIRNGARSERLVPLYLRKPDAVEPAARKAVGT